MLYGLWIPMSLLIAETSLAKTVKAPSVKLSMVAQCNRVALTCRATLDENVATIACFWKPNLNRCSNISVFTDTKLSHSSFTPTVHGTIICYCK